MARLPGLAVFLLAAGCFEPNLDFAEGQLRCDQGFCPPGFSCCADDHCYRACAATPDAPQVLPDAAGGGGLAIDPAQPDFGTAVAGTNGMALVFEVENGGAAETADLDVQLTGGDFKVDSDGCSGHPLG